MDLALYISTIEDYSGKKLESYKRDYGVSDSNGVRDSYDKLITYLQDQYKDEIEYLYFGCEFCEHLIPNKEQLVLFREKCEEDGISPVFVTPVTADIGNEKLRNCFEILKRWQPNMEIVINDYGVMELLNIEYPHFRKTAGRVLDKLSHDSRASAEELDVYYGSSGIKYARKPGITSQVYRRLLATYGVERYEFDLPKVGVDIAGEQVVSGLYWPFNYLTTGRICLFRATQKKGKNKFIIDNKACLQPCKEIELELRKTLNGFRIENNKKKESEYIFQKGNTLFYLYDNVNLESVLSQFQRIIIQVI